MLRFGRTFFLTLAGLALAAGQPARADGRLEAQYRVSIAGMELGRANFKLDVGPASYSASGDGRVTGLARVISSGRGSADARGALDRGVASPQSFTVDSRSGRKTEAIRLVLAGRAVKDVSVTPPVKESADRVPVKDADMKGVLDPMSAALMFVEGKGDLMAPDNCNRVLAIFDGRQRFDLTLSYERTEHVEAPGYDGPSLVCRVAYRPVSGHKPDRTAVKYMTRNKEVYVWLVPLAGTRVLVPFRASVATLIGTAEMEAVSFEARAGSQASARGERRP